MIRGLYTAASGMTAQQDNIDVISNNIANVNTTAFKKSRTEFQDLMYQSLNYTAGNTSAESPNPIGVNSGLGVRVSGIQREHLQGALKNTGNDLDIAIQGNGFFQVRHATTGEIFYTRDGSFHPAGSGTFKDQLVTTAGHLVNPNDPITVNPGDTFTINANGSVDVNNGTTTKTNEFEIELFNFVNPAGLKPEGGNLYSKTDISGDEDGGMPAQGEFGSLAQGFLENSNVQLVTEMVNLIQAQRGYEANSKSIQTTDGMLQTVNQLKR